MFHLFEKMTNTIVQQPLIPKLRFSEFSWEWEQKKYEILFDRVVRKNIINNKNVLTISAQMGLINQKEYFNKSVSSKNITGYYLLEKGEFAYNKSYSNWYPFWAIKRLNRYDLWVVSTLYICFRIKKDDSWEFIEQYFNSQNQNKQIAQIAQEWARNHGLLNVSVTDFFKDLFIPIGKPTEQQKIADFLSLVDRKIENLKAKKEQLERYKKWVMQKIFSQEIRFKDENGNDFKDWEEKNINEVWESFSGLSWKTWEDFWEGSNYITYKQIFWSSKIDISKCEKVAISKDEKQNQVSFWDVFFTVSSESPEEIWFASVLLNNKDDCYLNSFCFWLRPKSLKVLVPEYSRFFFRSYVYRKEVVKLAQWSTRYNLSKVNFMKMKFFFPWYDEQRKIAISLTHIEEKIEKESLKIEKAEEFKKGLLQQMFI